MKIQAFMDALRVQTQSKETLRAYRQDIQRFEAFLIEKGLRANQVNPATIVDYIGHMNEHQGRTAGNTLSAATISRRLAVVSRYYEWLVEDSGRAARNPVDRVRRPKVHNDSPKAVDDAVLVKLVDGISDLRDKAIVLLFLYSGLRLSELAQLNKDSFTLRRRKVPDGPGEFYGTAEVIGKGAKRRQFLVGPKAMEALAKYVAAERNDDGFPALFLSSRKTRLSCRAIQQVVDKWCRRIGLKHLHVHQLRHSFATRNVNAGMSSAVLRDLMGHSNLATTQRYFSIRPERLAREYYAAMEFVRRTSDV